MSPNEKKINGYQMARMMQTAFIFSLVLYGLVVWILSHYLNDPMIQSGNPNSLRLYFYAAAVLIVIFVRRLRPFLVQRKPILQVTIITAALCEIPALLGIVHFLLTLIKRDFYFLCGLSLILMIMYFPRPAEGKD